MSTPITPSSRILGPTDPTATVATALAYVESRHDRGPVVNYSSVDGYVRELHRLCLLSGVRFEVAFPQACDECDVFRDRTYWGAFGNPVGFGAEETLDRPGEINYTGGRWTPVGAARVHLVHLWLYAGGTVLPSALAPYKELDTRWTKALRYAGISPTLAGLGGQPDGASRWAANPNYAKQIAAHANRAFPTLGTATAPTPPKETPTMAGIGKRPLRLAIGVGHANTSGGNAYERLRNAEVVNALIKLARQSTGFDVRSYTPGDGLGWFNGPLDAAVRQTVTWAAAGWVPDIVWEVHHQGLGNTSIRGGFEIYADSSGLNSPYYNPGELDVDAREHADEIAAIYTRDALGGPIWGSGKMSEKHTGVGGQGYRLGYFGATCTPQFMASVTRVLSEALTFTNPQDRAMMDRPDFAARSAAGLLASVADLGRKRLGWEGAYRIGAPTKPAPEPGTPKPEPAAHIIKTPRKLQREGGADKAFGLLTVDGTPYRFDPNGPVSRVWVREGWRLYRNHPTIAMARAFSPLVAVTAVDQDQDGFATAKRFDFANGLSVFRPEDDLDIIVVRTGTAEAA